MRQPLLILLVVAGSAIAATCVRERTDDVWVEYVDNAIKWRVTVALDTGDPDEPMVRFTVTSGTHGTFSMTPTLQVGDGPFCAPAGTYDEPVFSVPLRLVDAPVALRGGYGYVKRWPVAGAYEVVGILHVAAHVRERR